MDGAPVPRTVEDFTCRTMLPEVLIFHPVCLDEAEMLVAEDVLRLAAPPSRIAVGTVAVTAGEGEGHYTR